jgi:hypothetical protein
LSKAKTHRPDVPQMLAVGYGAVARRVVRDVLVTRLTPPYEITKIRSQGLLIPSRASSATVG